jgi:hypothetical protein
MDKYVVPDGGRAPSSDAVVPADVPAPELATITPADVPAPELATITPADVPAPELADITPANVPAPKMADIIPAGVSAPATATIVPGDVSAPTLAAIIPAKESAPASTSVAVPVRCPAKLSRATRRGLWVLLVVLQLTNAVLLALLAALYFSRTQNGSLLWLAMLRFLFSDAYAFIDSFYIVLAMGYTLISAVFAVNGLRLVYFSVRSRRLRFGPSSRFDSRSVLLQTEANMISAVFSPLRFRDWVAKSRTRRVLEWFESALFLVGVNGPLFDVRVTVDRIIGVITQTIAAYTSSQNISGIYLNQAYGVVIFLSCVATPTLHRVLRHSSRTQQRVAHLLVDLVLDFIWGSLLPMWTHLRIVFSDYATLADTATTARALGHVLMLSWFNFFLSLVPFIASIFSAQEIQEVLHLWPGPQARPDLSVRDAKQLPPRADDKAALKTFVRFVRKWVLVIIQATIAVYGCLILAISLSASDIRGSVVKHPEYPCVSPLHPWFSTKEACVKRYVNCTALGIVGHSGDIEAAIQLFDLGSLSDLHLQSCPALEVPTTLDQFSGLIRLVIEKSWIAEWSHNAAISLEKTPTVRTVKLIRVDTNVTLHGLVSVPVSTSIEYIRFFKVPNADTILRPIGFNWQHVRFFDCDDCGLPDVPSAIDTMYRLEQLSLMGSRITTLRDDWITRFKLRITALWLDDSANITELSDVVWRQAATSSMFSMQGTNLSFIPEWLPTVARKDFLVLGHGSPVCDPTKNLLQIASPKVRQLVSCEPA